MIRRNQAPFLSEGIFASTGTNQDQEDVLVNGEHNGYYATNGASTTTLGSNRGTDCLEDIEEEQNANFHNTVVISNDSPPEVAHWTEIMSHGFATDASNSTAFLDAVLNDYDLKQIEKYWDKLMPVVSYLGTEFAGKVYQALCVAYRAHRGQMRKSGEPFIIHPVEVAFLLAGLRMDGETVIAGLLHDTVEDTELTFSQVEALFGKTVKTIVEGETKVSKLPKLAFSEYADEQAENLRQMFIAMTEDYRIIIVKLADRYVKLMGVCMDTDWLLEILTSSLVQCRIHNMVSQLLWVGSILLCLLKPLSLRCVQF